MAGRLETLTVESKALAGNPLGDPSRRTLRVYVPQAYDAGTQRLPVVYFLHAFTGSGAGFLNVQAYGRTVPERVERVLAAGAPPFLTVFIDAWTALGGTQYVNSAAVGRYRDYVTQDVVPLVDRTFRTVPDARGRAVVGHSSGGYGALVMGRHHPDLFGHVVSHSGDAGFEYCYLQDFPRAAGAFLKAGGHEPWYRELRRRVDETKMRGDDHPTLNTLAMAACYSPRDGAPMGIELPFEPETCRLRPDVWDRWLENDPVRFVPRSVDAFGRLHSLFLDCGTRDEANLRWGTRMVAESLRKAGIGHVHEEFEDGHSGVSYRYERSLAYVAPRLLRD